MIKISKSVAMRAINQSKLPSSLLEKGITIIMSEKDGKGWLQAMRSGKYKQADGTLYDGNGGFCCLGLEQARNWGGKVEACVLDGEPNDMPSIEYLRQTGKGYFTNEGKLTNDPYLGVYKDCEYSASEMNDAGVSFKEIAEAVEKHIAVY